MSQVSRFCLSVCVYIHTFIWVRMNQSRLEEVLHLARRSRLFFAYRLEEYKNKLKHKPFSSGNNYFKTQALFFARGNNYFFIKIIISVLLNDTPTWCLLLRT